jgi:hypothetical protein
LIDRGSDFELGIECDEEIENPGKLFESIFKALSISDPLLKDFIFEKRYAVCV